MAFNTGNALGSTDPRDLSDNAENLDRFANGTDPAYNDRLSKSRKSLAGMESDFASDQSERATTFANFLASSGYEFLGEYAGGIEVTEYNQIIRESGEFWRPAASTSLPYTTTGAGMPESGAFVAVGDAALRQEIGSGIFRADSLANLESTNGRFDGDAARLVSGTGRDGDFRWDSSDLSSTLVLASATSDSVDDTTDTINDADHPFSDGDGVITQTTVNGLTAHTVYWVVNSTSGTYQLSATLGGGAVDLTGTTNVTIDHLLDPLQGVYVTPTVDKTGGSGAWSRLVNGSVFVSWFGALGDGSTDDAAALQGAFDYAEFESSEGGRANSIPLATSNFPAVEVRFGYGKYRVGSQVVVPTGRISLKGDNSLIFANNGDIPEGYPLKFAKGYRVFVHKLSIGCAENGAVDVDAPNISGAAFSFSECNFLGNKSDDGLVVTGTAIRYSNQSSILNISECQFHNVKHPIDQILGDIVNFTGCWFDITASELSYADDTGYFNNIREKLTITNCIAASGPGDKGTRVAYFNCENDIFLTIRGGRLGYEDGGGPLINWKVPVDLTNGLFDRPGFVIDNITTAPRGQNESYHTRVATPLVRLYEMPNRATVQNIDWVNTIQGVFAAAPSTDIDTLYAAARAQLTLYSQTSYQYLNHTGNEMYLVSTTDEVKYKAWLELFNCTSYEFNTEVKGNASPHNIITHFDGDRLKSSYTATIESTFSTEGSGLSKKLDISFELDALAGNVTAVVTELSSTGPVGAGANDYTVSAQFYDKVAGTYSSSISDGSLDDYYLALVLTKTGTRDIGVKNCTIVPDRSVSLSSVGSSGVPRQFFQVQS